MPTYILSITGIILHFDNSDLSDYYFIDPHWLYDVFCQVCTTSVLISNNINCEWSYTVAIRNTVYYYMHMYMRNLNCTYVAMYACMFILKLVVSSDKYQQSNIHTCT